MDRTYFEKRLAETLAVHGRSPRTVDTYTWMLRSFEKYLTTYLAKPLDEVTPDDVATYQRYLVTERKVGFSALNQTTCSLRFFYRTCLGHTDWEFARMPITRKRRCLPEILSVQELAQILEACTNLKHRALLMTAYSGGLRLRETLGLVLSDIDSQRMVIRIEQGKGRKDRCVRLSPVLLETLRTYFRAFRPVRYLFEGRTKGEPLAPSTAEKIFTAAAGRAGIRKAVSFHSLRHAYATHLLERGTSIVTIQHLLGHQSLMSTQVYLHVAKTTIHATESPLDDLPIGGEPNAKPKDSSEPEK
jgi:site-specific recombinase XerD